MAAVAQTEGKREQASSANFQVAVDFPIERICDEFDCVSLSAPHVYDRPAD